MKKTTLLLPLLILSFLTFSQLSGDSFAEARQTKKATLTYVYEGIEGFSMKNSNGEVEGLLVDIMSQFERYVKEKHDITLTPQFEVVENKDFKLYLKQVQNGKNGVFGISPTSIKKERESILQFTPPYLSNISVLITNKNVSTLSSMSNIASTFSSMEAYTVPSTTFSDRMDELKESSFSSLKINYVPSMYEMVDRIAQNEKSFGFVDLNYYFDYLEKGSPIKRHPVGDLKGDEWGIIMPLNSDWQPVITAFFNSGFLKSSEYRQMLIDNLGKWSLRMIE